MDNAMVGSVQTSVTARDMDYRMAVVIQKRAQDMAKEQGESDLQLIEQVQRVLPPPPTKTRGNHVNVIV